MSARPGRRRSEGLRPRQLEVLRAASFGKTCSETAAELGIRPDTVREHRESARRRLAARNTAHAVAIALELGILP